MVEEEETSRPRQTPTDGFEEANNALSLELNTIVQQLCEDEELTNLQYTVERLKEQADKAILQQPLGLQRFVMRNLRAMGHNAGVCKSTWNQSSGLSQGEYAYIDVLAHPNKRIIIDLDFKMQFEIARPSKQYISILDNIPLVFVGGSEHLQRLLPIISAAMRLSLRRQHLMLPPWRKADYLQAKWFSTYRRTTCPLSSKLSDWQFPTVNLKQAKSASRPTLTKLLTEAKLMTKQNQQQPVAVAAM